MYGFEFNNFVSSVQSLPYQCWMPHDVMCRVIHRKTMIDDLQLIFTYVISPLSDQSIKSHFKDNFLQPKLYMIQLVQMCLHIV
jgi:hypothetical protein